MWRLYHIRFPVVHFKHFRIHVLSIILKFWRMVLQVHGARLEEYTRSGASTFIVCKYVSCAAQKLGLPLSPPYEGNPANITCGVNYASGGGGIRPETGFLVGEVLNIQQQLENHKVIIAKLKKQGINNMSECLYTVNIGSNDYINNYYALGYFTWLFYTPEEYAAELITRYREFLQELFSLGARKVALFSLSPLGCLPSQITIHFATQGSVCFEDENKAIDMFNQGVKSLVDEFNANYTGAKFTYINYGGIFPKPNTQ
ncbi:hypothetical protein Droror1_Dr00005545, partial [Drosera rotundifolia]